MFEWLKEGNLKLNAKTVTCSTVDWNISATKFLKKKEWSWQETDAVKKTQRVYPKSRMMKKASWAKLLAIVKAVDHLHPHLCGQKFVIRTDLVALKLVNFQNPKGHTARWLEQLQYYDFKIQHCLGKAHKNVDTLSRRPCGENCSHCVSQEKKELTVSLIRVQKFEHGGNFFSKKLL